MRLIDADAFTEFLKDAVKQQKYEDLKIDGLLTVADVIEAVISELDGTSFDGFKNAPTIEPDSDTISRQAVISTINTMREKCDTDDIDDYHDLLLESVEVLPPSLSRPPWIPCSEWLPEGKQEVLVTEYGDTDIGRRFEGRWLDRYGDKMKDVTAWMPKPEPYRP